MSKIRVGFMCSLIALTLATSGSSAQALEQDDAANVGGAATDEVPSKSITELGKIALSPLPPATVASAKDETAIPSIFPTSVVMVSTTDKIPGYQTLGYKGLVRGDVVIEPTIMQSLKSTFKGIVGGKIDPYTRMCNRARLEAYEGMVQQAQQLGANAVVGMQFDASTFSVDDNDVATEVFCYGTAVNVAPDSNRVSLKGPAEVPSNKILVNKSLATKSLMNKSLLNKSQ